MLDHMNNTFRNTVFYVSVDVPLTQVALILQNYMKIMQTYIFTKKNSNHFTVSVKKIFVFFQKHLTLRTTIF